MQIIPLSTQLPTLGPVTSADPRPVATPHGEERDTVELSGERPPPLGQAENLPGQGEAPEVIGLCPDCGRVHALTADSVTGSSSSIQGAAGEASAVSERPELLAESGTVASGDHGPTDGHVHSDGTPSPAGGQPFSASSELAESEEDDPAETKSDGEATKASDKRGLTGQELTDGQRQEVDRLKERDREVRTHEQAHVAAGGQYVRGGIQFEYETGPDGRRYAVGGEVSIDSSPVPDDPQKTIQKAQQIRRAAMAPAEPSGQDQRVASAASQMEAEARQDLIEARLDEGESETPEATDGASEGDAAAVETGVTTDAIDEAEAPEITETRASAASIAPDVTDGDVEAASTADTTGTEKASSVAGPHQPPTFNVVPTGDDEESGPFGEAVSPLDIPKIDSAGPAGGVVTLSYVRETASPAGSFVDLYS